MIDNILQLIGRFHPLIVHLPIGLLLVAAVLAFVQHRPQFQALKPAQSFLLLWGTISAVAAGVAGYILKSEGGYDAEAVDYHQWSGIALAVVALWTYCGEKYAFLPQYPKINALLLGVLVMVAGHFGGNLTHGSDYLKQPALAVLGLKKAETTKNEPINIADPNTALVYKNLIEPLLKQKCWQCHNAEKQKGSLRMDKVELLTKGGKSGVVFVAGQALSSELYKRLMLPEEDEHHMPPKGKPQMTTEEIALLHWWIQQGASFDKTLAQTPTDEPIKNILAKIGGTMPQNTAKDTLSQRLDKPDVPNEKVEPASTEAIEALEKLGVYIKPIADNSNYLAANCVNAPNFNDAQTALLQPLNKQLVWLRLSNTKITDKGIQDIAKLTALTRLELENTAVADVGLVAIASQLKNLQVLNLFNTQVSDAQIEKLMAIKTLEAVYLYQTKVSEKGINALKKGLPNAEIVGKQAEIDNKIE
jgi:uncharacterized membrane protein/mono/diheme cytochrome c family protein